MSVENRQTALLGINLTAQIPDQNTLTEIAALSEGIPSSIQILDESLSQSRDVVTRRMQEITTSQANLDREGQDPVVPLSSCLYAVIDTLKHSDNPNVVIHVQDADGQPAILSFNNDTLSIAPVGQGPFHKQLILPSPSTLDPKAPTANKIYLPQSTASWVEKVNSLRRDALTAPIANHPDKQSGEEDMDSLKEVLTDPDFTYRLLLSELEQLIEHNNAGYLLELSKTPEIENCLQIVLSYEGKENDGAPINASPLLKQLIRAVRQKQEQVTFDQKQTVRAPEDEFFLRHRGDWINIPSGEDASGFIDGLYARITVAQAKTESVVEHQNPNDAKDFINFLTNKALSLERIYLSVIMNASESNQEIISQSHTQGASPKLDFYYFTLKLKFSQQ
jgi:hypothetical protein